MRRTSFALLFGLSAFAACSTDSTATPLDASAEHDAGALDALTADAVVGHDAAHTGDAAVTIDATASDAAVLGDAASMDAFVAHDAASDLGSPDLGIPEPSCTLGEYFGDFFRHSWMHLLRDQWHAAGDTLPAVREMQFIKAVQEAGHADVSTVTDAFETVDFAEFRYVRVYDESNRRIFEGIEFGLGENGYGAVFDDGTTTVFSRIIDSSVGCDLPRGRHGAPCAEGCGPSLTCATSLGRCVDTTPVLGEGNECNYDEECAVDFGLLCDGLNYGSPGICRPSWMRGRFIKPLSDVFPTSGTSRNYDFAITGLTTVSTDVWVGIDTHLTDYSAVNITVTNPSGTTGTFVRGDPSLQGSLWLFRILGIPGDESANGAWTVTVSTTAPIAAPIDGIELRLGSRWD